MVMAGALTPAAPEMKVPGGTPGHTAGLASSGKHLLGDSGNLSADVDARGLGANDHHALPSECLARAVVVAVHLPAREAALACYVRHPRLRVVPGTDHDCVACPLLRSRFLRPASLKQSGSRAGNSCPSLSWCTQVCSGVCTPAAAVGAPLRVSRAAAQGP